MDSPSISPFPAFHESFLGRTRQVSRGEWLKHNVVVPLLLNIDDKATGAGAFSLAGLQMTTSARGSATCTTLISIMMMGLDIIAIHVPVAVDEISSHAYRHTYQSTDELPCTLAYLHKRGA